MKKSRNKEATDAAWNTTYRSYKNSAKKRNLAFSISLDYFKFLCKQDCYYCGCSPNRQFSPYLNKKNILIDKHISIDRALKSIILVNGIDRVDNKRGYDEGNCISCCFFCNDKKSSTDFEEFKEWIERVYKNLCHQQSIINNAS